MIDTVRNYREYGVIRAGTGEYLNMDNLFNRSVNSQIKSANLYYKNGFLIMDFLNYMG